MVGADRPEGAMDGEVKRPLRFWIDHCDREEISGWADADGPVESLSIELDGEWIATLSATMSRPDLLEHGIGERRGFAFPLQGYLRGKEAIVTVTLRADGTEFFRRELLPEHIDPNANHTRETRDRLFCLSQSRWKGDEPETGLTWGAMMDGRSLWKIYSRAHLFRNSDKVLEVGPGYGRVLKTALDNGVPFRSYIGVDLSQARVAKLSEQFSDARVKFLVGDIGDWSWHEPFDVVICSATFEHLYPDCEKALSNIRQQAASGAALFIDFIHSHTSHAVFEPNGTFIRWYNERELQSIFCKCGYRVLDIVSCVLGIAADGSKIRRNVVIAAPS
jgi:SAM-dependent methyltransferase